MFPNFCFNKPPADYSIFYLPTSKAVRSTRSRPLGSHHKKGRCNDSVPPQVLCGSNGGLSSSARLKTQSAHKVGFRKHKSGRRQCKQSRQAAGAEMDEGGCEQGAKSGSSESAYQESCVNFFNVLYDKILESLHNTIEHMMSKHFGGILCSIEELAAKLNQQQIDIKRLKADVTNKINQQNETNLNQFKFIAQMLVENHTLFYGIINPQRHLSKESEPQSNEDADGARKAGGVENPAQQKPSSPPDQAQEGKLRKRIEHHLSEQQDMDTVVPKPCHQKMEKSAHVRSSHSAILCGKGRRSAARTSMPDLRSDASCEQNQECADPINSLRKCGCTCASTKPDQAQPSAAVGGQKYHSLNKIFQSADVRFQR